MKNLADNIEKDWKNNTNIYFTIVGFESEHMELINRYHTWLLQIFNAYLKILFSPCAM